jgi:hypothetical protein
MQMKKKGFLEHLKTSHSILMRMSILWQLLSLSKTQIIDLPWLRVNLPVQVQKSNQFAVK